jgi:hypothetical protein
MATTTRHGLRYPALTDMPHGPQQVRNLAEDVEGWLARAYPCTSTTRPTGVADGFLIRETDTGRVYIWNASAAPSGAWERLALLSDVGTGSGGSGTGAPTAAATYAATTTQTVGNEVDAVVAFGNAVTTDPLVTRATNGAGHKFALGSTGIWVITATVRWAQAANGGRTFELRAGSTVLAKVGAGVTGNAPWTANLAITRKFSSGTEVHVYGRQDSGGTLALEHGGGSYVHIDLALVA